MEPIPGPLDNQHPLTGNVPVHKVGDVNAILRALAEQKRQRHDLLGRRLNTTEED